MNTPKQEYENREARYNRQLKGLQKFERRLSNLRLAVFVLGVVAAITTYQQANYFLLTISLLLFAAIFVSLVVSHAKSLKEIKQITLLRDINSEGLQRLAGAWDQFADAGKDFVGDKHSYTSDLDIFGPRSVFQWISVAKTFAGRQKLRELLSELQGNRAAILERQQAVAELADKLSWRQRFQAAGMLAKGATRDSGEIIAWAMEANQFFRKPVVIALMRLCPALTIVLLILAFGFDLIPSILPAAALVLQFALLNYKRQERERVFNLAERYATDLQIYHQLLRLVEEEKFQAPLLVNIKEGMKGQVGVAAYRQLDKLAALMNAAGDRRNMFFMVFNILLLWDFRNLIALERWKQQAGAYLEDWLAALGRVEALASLAIIRFENPDWVFPDLCVDDGAVLEAQTIGHPLLPERKGQNDIALGGGTRALLVTGSNMSGKSTFLRTAGVNLVLAYAGAPVCAREFRASLMEVNTCMRIGDNLGESVSSFYAELLRIKEIVQKAEAGRSVFYLLDEVFKGTNSRDRHTGAKVLINKLTGTNAIGLVSTHDLELCGLEAENQRVTNFHFQEYYEDDKIYFDYQLRPGPSETRNALYLMKLAGIVEEAD